MQFLGMACARLRRHKLYVNGRAAQQVAARRRASAAQQIPMPRPRGGGKRTKEERTTDTFRRARSRLQAILVRLGPPAQAAGSWLQRMLSQEIFLHVGLRLQAFLVLLASPLGRVIRAWSRACIPSLRVPST